MQSRRPARVVAYVVLGVVAVGVVTVAVGLIAFLLRSEPASRSLPEAIEEFRLSTLPPPAIATDPPTPTVVMSTGSEQHSGPPPPGVYVGDGAGSASIDLPPMAQRYGDDVIVTVLVDESDTESATESDAGSGGCWTIIVDLNEAFRQRWAMCSTADGLRHRTEIVEARWDLGLVAIDNQTSFLCDPAPTIHLRRSSSSETEAACTATNTSIDGDTEAVARYTVSDPTRARIGDQWVEIITVREVRDLTGAQRGRSVTEFDLRLDDYLLVGMRRTTELRSDSPIGEVTFSEGGRWALRSVTPVDGDTDVVTR